MTQTVETEKIVLPPPFPDHTQLPESDGTFVKNFQEHPQSIILTESINPILEQLHPDGQYIIGQDCGIYWQQTEPPEKGAKAPDWFYVANVPPKLDGRMRRSYVLWREHIAPLIALELASGNGSEERDKTPLSRTEDGTKTEPGKFWVYEQVIRIPYYGIYEINRGLLEVYTLVSGFYQQMTPNERGHYPIAPLGVELGLWEGNYYNQQMLWLRWWDEQGNLLLTGTEQVINVEREKDAEAIARQQAEQQRDAEAIARQQAERQRDAEEIARQQAERQRDAEVQARREAIPQLLAMGLSQQQVAQALSLTVEEVQRYSP